MIPLLSRLSQNAVVPIVPQEIESDEMRGTGDSNAKEWNKGERERRNCAHARITAKRRGESRSNGENEIGEANRVKERIGHTLARKQNKCCCKYARNNVAPPGVSDELWRKSILSTVYEKHDACGDTPRMQQRNAVHADLARRGAQHRRPAVDHRRDDDAGDNNRRECRGCQTSEHARRACYGDGTRPSGERRGDARAYRGER